MNATVTRCLEALEPLDPQTWKRVSVIPLVAAPPEGIRYPTASESFRDGTITVTEVDESGSVPELQVVSIAPEPVLILDGEELTGAKQNRVLNTTILVPAASRLVVPVSCTEQGRWNYTAPEFDDSGVVLARKARAAKARSVSSSLKARRSFESDQIGVWEDVQALHESLGTESDTGAMKDAYEAKRVDLDDVLASFPVCENQQGLLVVVDGRVAGLDMVSHPEVYRQVHARLLRSYLIECLSEENSGGEGVPAIDSARSFLASLIACREEVFPSVGLGDDHRYQDESVHGSVLVHEDEVVHAVFFARDQHDGPDPQGPRHRRGVRC